MSALVLSVAAAAVVVIIIVVGGNIVRFLFNLGFGFWFSSTQEIVEIFKLAKMRHRMFYCLLLVLDVKNKF